MSACLRSNPTLECMGFPNGRSWHHLRLHPKSAFPHLPPFHKASLEGPLRVDLTRSPNRRRMSGSCAQRPLIMRTQLRQTKSRHRAAH